jgi:hypothetical protein
VLNSAWHALNEELRQRRLAHVREKRGEKFELCSANEAVPAKDFISAERNFAEVRLFAPPLAELVAPPTMRHHAESSSTMIADLELSHHALAQQFKGISLR